MQKYLMDKLLTNVFQHNLTRCGYVKTHLKPQCWCISLSTCRIEPDHEYKAFLVNSSNKQSLKKLLAEYMDNVDITVHSVQHAEGDSD